MKLTPVFHDLIEPLEPASKGPIGLTVSLKIIRLIRGDMLHVWRSTFLKLESHTKNYEN